MNNAYLAGILDGEGNVSFCRSRTAVFPRVLIVNTNLELLEAIQEAHGGDIKQLSCRKAGWKQAYQWRLSNSRCVELLDKLRPWLRIKAPLADLVFAWDAIRPGSAGRWSDEGRAALDLIIAQARWLTKRGDGEKGEEPMLVALREAC